MGGNGSSFAIALAWNRLRGPATCHIMAGGGTFSLPVEPFLNIARLKIHLVFVSYKPLSLHQVGAIIVDRSGRVVGEGWNRMPAGCENRFGWNKDWRDEGVLETKYPYGESFIYN